MLSHKLTKYIAAGGAVAVLASSGLAIATSSSTTGASGTATAAQSQTGTIVTGAAAAKAKAAALAKYSGTVNGVLKLSDGSYVVQLLGKSGTDYVFVSKDFKITGTAGGTAP